MTGWLLQRWQVAANWPLMGRNFSVDWFTRTLLNQDDANRNS